MDRPVVEGDLKATAEIPERDVCFAVVHCSPLGHAGKIKEQIEEQNQIEL